MSSSYFSDLDIEPEVAQPEDSSGSYFSDIPEEVSRERSLASAFPKGLVRGARKFSPLPSFGPIPDELAERLLEQFLPTQKGKAPEEILEFTGEMAPAAALGEGGLAKRGLQALAGGLAKKGAKDLDMPEWAQEMFGSVGMVAPSSFQKAFSKSIRPSSKQAEVVNFLRGKGFSEKEITPIIQDKKKLDILSKGALKFNRENEFFKAVDSKLGDLYSNLRMEGKKYGYLDGPNLQKFENEFFKAYDKIPDDFKGLISDPVDNLFNKPIDFTSLMDFKEAVNRRIREVQGGKAVLGLLKEPTKMGQGLISPDLLREQNLTDASYAGMKRFFRKMQKKDYEGVVKLKDTGKLVMGGLLLNPAMMGMGTKAAGIAGVTSLSLRQMLTNPRLQNMHKKLQQAVLENKMSQAIKISELIKKEMERIGSAETENE